MKPIQIRIGALNILGVLFVTLKVLGIGLVADWSWWLVLLPFCFGILALACVLFAALSLSIFMEVLGWITKRK